MGLPIVDTLRSLVTGLGTSKDKTISQSFGLRLVDEAELSSMHRSDWLARKIVDIIPNDMTREWRDWQADGPEIEKIEEVEKQFNLQPKLNKVLQMARLFGGAALYLGMKDGAPEQELIVDKVKAGDLLYVHVLSRHDAAVGEIIRDVTSPYYGEPRSYQVTAENGATVTVHPSRIIRFTGAPVLDDRQTDQQGWGDSILQIVYEAVQNAASAQQHVAALLPEAKADVIYVPGLSGFLKNATTTQQLTDRFTYANTIKSMFNMVLLEGDGKDAGEKWEQKQINFAQLPELMRQFLQIASGAADIPVTRLLGESPSGLNATGKSDLQNYYDNIAARQKTELSPALHRLDEVIIRSALGTRPKEIYFEWSPLWGMSEKEKAEVFKMKADAARAIAGTGTSPPLMPIEALSDALVNAFTEDGSLPGLEAAIDEYGRLSEQEPSEEEQMAAAGVAANENEPLKLVANDAEPRTLYVRRDVLNKAEIERWAKSQGFTDIVPDLHVTIAFSRTQVDWFKVGTSWSPKIEIEKGGPRQMERLGPDGKYIALLITASELVWRHREIVEAGASWDWPDYQPHISIQVGGEIDLTKVEPYQGKIVLGPEIFEDVKAD